jgi:hypothetical protein
MVTSHRVQALHPLLHGCRFAPALHSAIASP